MKFLQTLSTNKYLILQNIVKIKTKLNYDLKTKKILRFIKIIYMFWLK